MRINCKITIQLIDYQLINNLWIALSITNNFLSYKQDNPYYKIYVKKFL